jgi:hypothetical protein
MAPYCIFFEQAFLENSKQFSKQPEKMKLGIGYVFQYSTNPKNENLVIQSLS